MPGPKLVFSLRLPRLAVAAGESDDVDVDENGVVDMVVVAAVLLVVPVVVEVEVADDDGLLSVLLLRSELLEAALFALMLLVDMVTAVLRTVPALLSLERVSSSLKAAFPRGLCVCVCVCGGGSVSLFGA